jgi:hypothetical protein
MKMIIYFPGKNVQRIGKMAGQLGGVELTAANVEQAVLQFYRNTGSQVTQNCLFYM